MNHATGKLISRWTLVWLMLLVAAVRSLAAPITITHYTLGAHGPGYQEYLRQSAAAFEELHPNIKIQIEIGPSGAQYGEKYSIMIASGVEPDVTDFNTQRGRDFALLGTFLDLRPFFEKDSTIKLSRYYPSFQQTLVNLDGAIWSLPQDMYIVAPYINVDLFDKAGLQYPQAGWTWADASQMMKALTKDTNGDGIIDQYGTSRMWTRWYIAVAQAGGMEYDRRYFPTKAQFSDSKVRQGLQYLVDNLVAGNEPPHGMPNVAQFDFWKGKTGISFIDGPPIMGEGYLANADFKYDLALPPTGPDNNASLVTHNGLQISRGSKNPDAAWEWIRFLSTDPQTTRRKVALHSSVPALTGLMNVYQSVMGERLPAHWQVFFEIASNPKSFDWFVIPQATQIQAIENRYLQQVWKGTLSIDQAVEQLDTEINATLATFVK